MLEEQVTKTQVEETQVQQNSSTAALARTVRGRKHAWTVWRQGQLMRAQTSVKPLELQRSMKARRGWVQP